MPQSGPIWRVPGLNVLRDRSWAQLTLQEVERTASGEGVWRNNRHRISLVTDTVPDMAVQFESGHTHEFSISGPRSLFCPAGNTMKVRSGAMRWLQVVVDPQSWLALVPEHPEIASNLSPSEDLQDPLILEMMLALARDVEGDRVDRVLADTLGAAIALRILKRHSKACAMPQKWRPGLSGERKRRVCDYIEQHLGEELSLKTLADVACLSPYHFSRSFKRTTGLGVHRYVISRRLERAKMLLARNDLSLSDIASAVGFDSQATFTTRFRRQVGVTPGRFRGEIT